MKNIFSRLKKGFGTESPTAAVDKPAPAAPKEINTFMPATPALREAIIGFIIQSLQPYIDEKAVSVAGLYFYMACNSHEQEEAARLALYMDRPGMFKTNQLERKLLNHFIQLESDWIFQVHLVKDDQLPVTCIRKENFGLLVFRPDEKVADHCSKALVQVLTGQAAQDEYVLDSQKQLKFYVGRTSNPQLVSGKIQQNDIVFLDIGEPGFNELTGKPNLRVSRNHACIVYDARTSSWLLYPDKGGLPENGNKLKVHTGNDKVKWLNIYGVSHCLCDGDQVELGGAVIFRFRVIAD